MIHGLLYMCPCVAWITTRVLAVTLEYLDYVLSRSIGREVGGRQVGRSRLWEPDGEVEDNADMGRW